jgi:hypothetical protein
MGVKANLFFLLLISLTVAEGRADFCIIADPLEYTIYNQYQQPLPASEMSQFVSYSPFQIINGNVKLGDQITHALEFVFQQRTYYLLMAEDGKFTGEKSKAGRQSFRNVEAIEDTIETLADGLAMVSGSGRNIVIMKGVRLVRVFRSGPRYYIAALNDRVTYGWSSLEPKGIWRKSTPGVLPGKGVKDTGGLSEYVKQRILARFASANESYTTCFSHFNSLTGDEKAVPQWRCEASDNRIRCELIPHQSGDQLSESSRYLAQDIENLLVGTDFGVICKNGEIVIEKRSGSY